MKAELSANKKQGGAEDKTLAVSATVKPKSPHRGYRMENEVRRNQPLVLQGGGAYLILSINPSRCYNSPFH